MAKISKYEQMVGQVVDGVLVSDYRKTQKESLKTGRSYYKYEVELENIVWVSTTAFARKTYGRKLDKARQFSTKPKNSNKPSQEPKQEPVKDKPKDKVKDKPKETKTKTKTKQEKILEEEYDYYFNYYKNLLDDNFKYIIKEYVKDCEYTGKKVSVKTAIKKVYKIYREPETDFTAKSKFTNERRKNKNKAYNDAWKSLEIENRVQDMIKEAKDRLEKERQEEKEREKRIAKKLEFERRFIRKDEITKEEIDEINEDAYIGKDKAKYRFEEFVNELKNFDNVTIGGSTIYDNAENYFNFWNNFIIEQAEKSIEFDDCLVIRYISCLNEWLTEWQEKFHQAVINEWPAVEERRKQKQREQFEKIHGKDFEERWYKENFGDSKAKKGFNKFDNEFGKLKDVREIKKLYRKLSKENHPDLGGNETDFIQLKEAYDRAMARVA